MKTNSYKIELGIDLPQYNFRDKDKEFYSYWKHRIIGEIITDKYREFSPQFTCLDDKMLILFDMKKYPEYNIKTSLEFYDISKQSILNKIKVLRERLDKVDEIS